MSTTKSAWERQGRKGQQAPTAYDSNPFVSCHSGSNNIFGVKNL